MLKTLLISMLLFMKGGAIYDYKVESVEGGKINFADYKGKKILIVSTSSMCGNTPQYAELEKLYKKYEKNLVIIGFPCQSISASRNEAPTPRLKNSVPKKYAVSFPDGCKDLCERR